MGGELDGKFQRDGPGQLVREPGFGFGWRSEASSEAEASWTEKASEHLTNGNPFGEVEGPGSYGASPLFLLERMRARRPSGGGNGDVKPLLGEKRWGPLLTL